MLLVLFYLLTTHFTNKFYLNFFYVLEIFLDKRAVIVFFKPLLKIGLWLFLQREIYVLFCVTTVTVVSADKNTE